MRILKVNLILTWESNHFFDWNRTTKSITVVERWISRELSVERIMSIELATEQFWEIAVRESQIVMIIRNVEL